MHIPIANDAPSNRSSLLDAVHLMPLNGLAEMWGTLVRWRPFIMKRSYAGGSVVKRWKAKVLIVSQSAANKRATREDSSLFSVRNIPITQGQEVVTFFLKSRKKGMN